MTVVVAVVMTAMACPRARTCDDGCLKGSRCDARTNLCVDETDDAGQVDAGHRDAGVDAGTNNDAGTAQSWLGIGSGGTATSDRYRLEGVVGPPSPRGIASSAKYQLTTEENAR